MSAETKAALDAAIAAHISDETGDSAIVTGYVLHASHMTADDYERGSTGYFVEYAEQQPYHVGLGLTHQLLQAMEFGDDDD